MCHDESRHRSRLCQLCDGDEVFPAIRATDGLFWNHDIITRLNGGRKGTAFPQPISLVAQDRAVCPNDERCLQVGLVGWAARLAQIPARVMVRSISDGIRVVYLTRYQDELRQLGNEYGVTQA